MEMIDLRSRDGRLTGEAKERTLVHRDGDLHGTSHVWLTRYRAADKSADILLQKRSAGKDSFPGCYDISSAGHVPSGSDFLPSALRELREELGVDAPAEALHEAFTHIGYCESEFYGRIFKNYEYSRVYLMECDLDEKDFRLQTEEVESVRWMDYRKCREAVHNAMIDHCIFIDEMDSLCDAIEKYFADTGRPLAPARLTQTWAEDAQNDLEDWIEEQGIYLRQ